MIDPADESPTVLVVDDERNLADLYTSWLSQDYAVRTAYSGEDALDQFGRGVDVVLLDRRMPDLSGDDVLSRIRSDGTDTQVVMVTAVDPDFDVLDMGFDGYVTKPIEREDLHAIVEQVLTRQEYDEQLKEYYRLLAAQAALEAEKTEDELAASEEFAELERRISQLQSEADATVGQFDETDFEAAFRNLDEF